MGAVVLGVGLAAFMADQDSGNRARIEQPVRAHVREHWHGAGLHDRRS